MNNKGFGIPHIMAFAVFVGIVVYAFYSFTVSAGKFFNNGSEYKNYKNVYRKYITTSAVIVPNKSSNSTSANSSYDDMELKLANAAKDYINRKELKISRNQSFYISYTTLKNSKKIHELNDPQNSVPCNGYAKIINADDSIIYKGYLMCGNNYKTIGYDKKYEY